MLDVEKRLKFQNLLPSANLSYNFLSKGYNIWNNPNAALFSNNFKYGLEIGLPLRLSQGRGEYRAAKIKIQETRLDLAQERLAIDNKIRSYFNELAQYRQQVVIAEQALDNYQRLFNGENLRFRAGESSLFLLNTRENKVLEGRQKLIQLKTKFFKAYRALGWAAGQLR
jgi:outer membrane protein TolC